VHDRCFSSLQKVPIPVGPGIAPRSVDRSSASTQAALGNKGMAMAIPAASFLVFSQALQRNTNPHARPSGGAVAAEETQ
jgi:hypothetical protein